jgi:hypothetical protein
MREQGLNERSRGDLQFQFEQVHGIASTYFLTIFNTDRCVIKLHGRMVYILKGPIGREQDAV